MRYNVVATQGINTENGRRDVKIISVVIFAFLTVSIIILWVTRARNRRIKVHREIYETNSMQTDASTGRLESITSSCRSSFSFRNSFNSVLGNMIRPTRPVSATHASPTRRTTNDMSVLIAFDVPNQRSIASFVTIPLSSLRRNHQNRHRNSPIYPEPYLNNELSQDILEIEPPPVYKA